MLANSYERCLQILLGGGAGGGSDHLGPPRPRRPRRLRDLGRPLHRAHVDRLPPGSVPRRPPSVLLRGGDKDRAPVDYAQHGQPTTASQGIFFIIDSAHTKAAERWRKMNAAPWWPDGIATSKNIDAFHEVRKSVRALVLLGDGAQTE